MGSILTSGISLKTGLVLGSLRQYTSNRSWRGRLGTQGPTAGNVFIQICRDGAKQRTGVEGDWRRIGDGATKGAQWGRDPHRCTQETHNEYKRT